MLQVSITNADLLCCLFEKLSFRVIDAQVHASQEVSSEFVPPREAKMGRRDEQPILVVSVRNTSQACYYSYLVKNCLRNQVLIPTVVL